MAIDGHLRELERPTGEDPTDPGRDVADIGGTGGEELIVQRLESGRDLLRRDRDRLRGR